MQATKQVPEELTLFSIKPLSWARHVIYKVTTFMIEREPNIVQATKAKQFVKAGLADDAIPAGSFFRVSPYCRSSLRASKQMLVPTRGFLEAQRV
jgi:hypothetical protein